MDMRLTITAVVSAALMLLGAGHSQASVVQIEAAPKNLSSKEYKKTKKCKRSHKFREGRSGKKAVKAGRCITSNRNGKGIRSVGTYGNHHPSQARAVDVMVNHSGSCTAGQKTGNWVARYLQKNHKKYGIMYIQWNNRYWSPSHMRKNLPLKKWRPDHRSGCTHGHKDHVHVAFK